MATPVPVFRDLDLAEIEAMLKEHTYGRLAFSFRDRVDIEPIHYVYESGWLVCRTGPGTKLTLLEHHTWVAFEIDDVRGLFEWRSVVVEDIQRTRWERGDR
jgi:nitroimidazol reductase NimA-like FMN-containing flavoprotein (pyridoxamine 5'-phosphate oxidase superfamily)